MDRTKKMQRECSLSEGSGWRRCFGERMMVAPLAFSLELFQTYHEAELGVAHPLSSLPMVSENTEQKATIEKASDATLHPRYHLTRHRQWQTHHLPLGRWLTQGFSGSADYGRCPRNCCAKDAQDCSGIPAHSRGLSYAVEGARSLLCHFQA